MRDASMDPISGLGPYQFNKSVPHQHRLVFRSTSLLKIDKVPKLDDYRIASQIHASPPFRRNHSESEHRALIAFFQKNPIPSNISLAFSYSNMLGRESAELRVNRVSQIPIIIALSNTIDDFGKRETIGDAEYLARWALQIVQALRESESVLKSFPAGVEIQIEPKYSNRGKHIGEWIEFSWSNPNGFGSLKDKRLTAFQPSPLKWVQDVFLPRLKKAIRSLKAGQFNLQKFRAERRPPYLPSVKYYKAVFADLLERTQQPKNN
jgi:hypothetical protein